MAYSEDSRQLKDYEVLGVGASRRETLLQGAGSFILETHPELVPPSQKALYEAVLDETLHWLKPQAIREVKINKPASDFLLQVLLEDLKKYFPHTAQALKTDLKEILKSYLQEFPWQGPLLTEHFRYLPVFLKRKFQDSRLYLMAQREWLWSYLSFADFGFPPQEEGRIIANPSLQSLYTTFEIPELHLTEGLYIFYYDYSQRKVREHKLEVYDAAVVDLLQEDRKYTLDQLKEQVLLMELDANLPGDVWVKKFSSLAEEGIILVSRPHWIADSK
ncbi:hypothetical protein [Bdellovibrio sp. HCB337]|uniref:hypothetical protein n=1 Tax=Bdellovibrio sp. HCB337 TaxID=3394358 RepID=UPI0039A74085